MKILLLTDTHFGNRKDSLYFLKYQKKCFDEVIFKILENYQIDKIVHLGDVFDSRRSINFNTLSFVFENIFNKLVKYPIDIIVGNHDATFTNTNSLNSPSLLLQNNYSNIHVYSEAELSKDGLLYVPWINSENEKRTLDLIRKNSNNTNLVMGHLEIIGFTMHKNVYCEEGYNSDIFHKYDKVLSGHFHTKGKRENIEYIGSIWDNIHTDADEVKGIHVLDTETLELTVFENPYKIFTSLTYNDFLKTEKDILLSEKELKKLENTFLKVFVLNKTNPLLFENFEKQLESIPTASLVFENEIESIITENSLDSTEDTLSIIKKSLSEDYHNMFQNEEKRNAAEKLIVDLYYRALQI